MKFLFDGYNALLSFNRHTRLMLSCGLVAHRHDGRIRSLPIQTAGAIRCSHSELFRRVQLFRTEIHSRCLTGDNRKSSDDGPKRNRPPGGGRFLTDPGAVYDFNNW